MKRISSLLLILILIFSLILTGCAGQQAITTNTGESWEEEWTTVGSTIGIEEPGNGLSLLDNKDALTASGLYYAAWVIGDAEEYVNEDGDTTDLYDAQLYVLMQDCEDEDSAASCVEEWQEREEEIYSVMNMDTVECAGQTFTLLVYETTDEENPYANGVSAFTVYQMHAINVELSCQDSFEGEAYTILTEFLEGFHYAE